MQRSIKHIFAVVLAFFFLIAGTGFNIVKYCCSTCSEHGIEEVARKSCSSFHHHEDHSCCDSNHKQTDSTADDIACSDMNHHPNGCHILRLNVETPTIAEFIKNIATQIVLLLSFALPVAELFIIRTEATIVPDFSPPISLIHTGRQILVFKNVLII